MVNLSALNNISELTINTTVLESAENIIPNTATIANTESGGWFGVGVLLIFFIILIITLFRQDGDIRLDIVRSVFKASGLTFVFAVVMSVSNLISTIKPVLWFGTIFILMTMLLAYLKSKNRI